MKYNKQKLLLSAGFYCSNDLMAVGWGAKPNDSLTDGIEMPSARVFSG